MAGGELAVTDDVIWTRPSTCEAASCPEWRWLPAPDCWLQLRDSAKPDQVLTLSADDALELAAAFLRGEVVTIEG